MDRLPQEITANIISQFAGDGRNHGCNHGCKDGCNYGNDDGSDDRPALAPYATVSRAWQQRIEAITFAHITLNPARLASPLTAQALTPDRVRRFVHSIYVDVILPPYDEEARGRVEDDAERAGNDAAFTDAVRKVFALLSTPASASAVPRDANNNDYGGDSGYRPRILLSLGARCVSDVEDLEARKYRCSVLMFDRAKDIFELRYESSYLDLRLAEALPKLNCISQFYVKARRAHRTFAPRALCLIASRISSLESINWELFDNEKRDAALRKKLRADFANALQILPSTLQNFNLSYERREPSDHSFQTPSLLDEADQDNNDKLSLALHKLSHRLTSFHLEASVGPEVLWPLEHRELDKQQQKGDDSSDSNRPLLWPNMQQYSIDPGAIAPSGEWRYMRRPDATEYSEEDGDSYVSETIPVPGDEKNDYFRDKLDQDAAMSLLLAAARAAGRMPMLHSMFFVLHPPTPDNDTLYVFYDVNRSECLARGGRIGPAKLKIETYPVFVPDEEVMEAWRAAAKEHTGAESGLEVKIIDIMEWKMSVLRASEAQALIPGRTLTP